MGDNMDEDMVMDHDLNQDPLVDQSASLGLVSLLSELETSHGRIEDRIRQLEAVTARARQRRQWRQARNNPELSYMSVIEPNASVRNDNGVEVGEGRVNGKRDISQLAKALEMDLDVKKMDNDGGGDGDNGNFFDCNICLDMARDPILTCCGHLFCWVCFYQLSYVESSAKECPVCKGEVTDSNITPIYGNGKNPRVLELESGLKIPPRPHARRTESVRQQRVSRGVSQIQGVSPSFETNSNNSEAGGSRGPQRSRWFSSESPASLSSISSALNNAETLVEDLETYINDRVLRRTDAMLLPANHEMETFVANNQSDTNRSVPISNPSSSSGRRNGVSRGLSLEGRISRELRRRRAR